MPTDAEVEELARALCEVDWPEPAALAWNRRTNDIQERYRALARAALVYMARGQSALIARVKGYQAVDQDRAETLTKENGELRRVLAECAQSLVAVERERDALLGLLRRSYLHGAEGAVSVDHCDVPLCHEIAAALAAPSGDAPPAEMPRSGPET